MSASQRRKGAQAEREAFGLLSGLLGEQVWRRRGSDQSADGGHDLEILTDPNRDTGIAVEVKRQERAQLGTWMDQAEVSAVARGEAWLSAVMWRPSRRGWLVCMTVEDWARLVREGMR